MNARTRLLAFRAEKDLENYLLVQLSLLLSRLGQDLLVIGKQVTTAFGRRIDLLAIDATGAIHIIELKLGGTTPEIVGQVTDYLYWIRQLNTDEIVRVAARAPLRLNLKVAFQEWFGHPLPEAVNETQVLTIIAASIDLRTQRSLLAIRHPGLSTTMFRYVVQSDGVSLLPCCRDDQDVEASYAEATPLALRRRSAAATSDQSTLYDLRIDENAQCFWLNFAQCFTWDFVPFRFIYGLYQYWRRTQAAAGFHLPLLSEGHFGRQLSAITAVSDEWTRILHAPDKDMDAYEPLTELLPAWKRPDADQKAWGYLRKASARRRGESTAATK